MKRRYLVAFTVEAADITAAMAVADRILEGNDYNAMQLPTGADASGTVIPWERMAVMSIPRATDTVPSEEEVCGFCAAIVERTWAPIAGGE